MTDKEFITELKKLGYFKYVDSEQEKIIESSLIKHFSNDRSFFVDFEATSPFQSQDPRFYSCGDGESLFEEGGVIDMIEEMRPFFDKIGFAIVYTNDRYYEHTHTIVVNDKEYVLAEGSLLMWGETIAKFASMINHELELQKFEERIYIINNEDHYFVFLTCAQCKFLNSCVARDFRPLTDAEWVIKMTEEIFKLLDKQ